MTCGSVDVLTSITFDIMCVFDMFLVLHVSLKWDVLLSLYTHIHTYIYIYYTHLF